MTFDNHCLTVMVVCITLDSLIAGLWFLGGTP